jgi:hypothetical protein
MLSLWDASSSLGLHALSFFALGYPIDVETL